MRALLSTSEASLSEQVVFALLQHLPLNHDLIRLGASCSAAAAALRHHLAGLRLDFSLGAEPQHPVTVLSPPRSSLQPPVPLGFTYTTAFEPLTGGSGLMAGGGCCPSCVCSGGSDGASGGGGNGGSDGVHLERRRAQEASDGCGEGTGVPRCACGVAVPGGQRAYDPHVGGLVPTLLTADSGGRSAVAYLLECGPACACPATDPRTRKSSGLRYRQLPEGPAAAATAAEEEAARGDAAGPMCPARLTQRGLAVRVAIRWLAGKGWGVVAQEPIPAGCFVCLYGGEYVTTGEAQARLRVYDAGRQGHALLVVREILPSGLALRINIDATSVGNVARFFNHSCDGGSMVMLIRRRRGSFVPAAALFTSRDVAVGEELTFAYGPPSKGRRGENAVAAGADGSVGLQADSDRGAGGSRPCLCGTDACLGYLPDEVV